MAAQNGSAASCRRRLAVRVVLQHEPPRAVAEDERRALEEAHVVPDLVGHDLDLRHIFPDLLELLALVVKLAVYPRQDLEPAALVVRRGVAADVAAALERARAAALRWLDGQALWHEGAQLAVAVGQVGAQRRLDLLLGQRGEGSDLVRQLAFRTDAERNAAEAQICPGRKPPFSALKRPARP